MTVQPELDRLNISGLNHRCQDESELFFQRKSFDPRYCFELFRRAFLLKDQQAWACIFSQYRRLVLSWVERHPLAASLDEEPEYFLNRAFEKMSAVITPQKFNEFNDLKSLLRYLQLCVHSVIVDHARKREEAVLFDEDVEPEAVVFSADSPRPEGVESKVVQRIQSQALLEWVLKRLKSEQERVALYAIFCLALKPREILDEYPGTFNHIDEIYQVKENLLARLRRDDDLRQVLTGALQIGSSPSAKMQEK